MKHDYAYWNLAIQYQNSIIWWRFTIEVNSETEKKFCLLWSDSQQMSAFSFSNTLAVVDCPTIFNNRLWWIEKLYNSRHPLGEMHHFVVVIFASHFFLQGVQGGLNSTVWSSKGHGGMGIWILISLLLAWHFNCTSRWLFWCLSVEQFCCGLRAFK